MVMPTLTDATLQRRESSVVATWSIAGDLPAADVWVLTATLVGGVDGPIHRFGLKFDGDRLKKAYVFDHGTATNLYLAITPQRVGSTFTAVFPLGDLTVAEAGRWTAALTLGHRDLGTITGDL